MAIDQATPVVSFDLRTTPNGKRLLSLVRTLRLPELPTGDPAATTDPLDARSIWPKREPITDAELYPERKD